MMHTIFEIMRERIGGAAHLQAPIGAPPPAPPGSYTPRDEWPVSVPDPEGPAPQVDEPQPNPVQPVEEPARGWPQFVLASGCAWMH